MTAREEAEYSSETCSFSVSIFHFFDVLVWNIFFPPPLFFFSIMGVLSNKCGFQLQYQMIFSIWLLAFSPQMCEHLRRYNIIPVLSDILQESVKEKVTRIILAAFRVSPQREIVIVVGMCMCAAFFFFTLIIFERWEVRHVTERNVWPGEEVHFGYIQMEEVPFCCSACCRTITGVFSQVLYFSLEVSDPGSPD